MNSKQIKVRGCILCYGGGIKNESFINDNTNIGEINHFLYVIKGSGKVKVSNNEINLEDGCFIDLNTFTGNKLSYFIDSDSEWVAFNSLLERKMEVQIIKETPATIYKNDINETIFVMIKGEANINNNKLTLFKSGRLFKGKEAKITLEQNSLLAAITFKNN